MSFFFVTALVLILASCPLASTTSSSDTKDDSASKRYKFLFFPHTIGGSHFSLLSKSANVLAQRGHEVVFLKSSRDARTTTKDDDLFSVVEIKSPFKTQPWVEASNVVLKGNLGSFFQGLRAHWYEGKLEDIIDYATGYKDCDSLFGDAATMKRLREEKVDLLVADDDLDCSPLLAQALDVPFILSCITFGYPAQHQTALPMDPSYIPERNFGLTDKMTFFQRVQNVLFYALRDFIYRLRLGKSDELKIKYNIKPEISTFESRKQAKLHLIHASFGLEFPRPMYPNTIHVLHTVGLSSNQTIEEDVAKFLDTASNGVILFSLGTFLAMECEQAQLFADGFARLPHRVLWQASGDLSKVKLGNNTKIVKWLPIPRIMEHNNVKAYVSHVGAPSMYEAMWAGLPMVGLPLGADQPDNMVRVVDRGAGISLDIRTLTPETLSAAISAVMTEPRFRENAQRISRIIRDLQTSSPPVETVVHWILHVARFGGDHLRPAVHDLNYVQRNLLDVYLFLSVIVAIIVGVIMGTCSFCFKCMCGVHKGGTVAKRHVKME